MKDYLGYAGKVCVVTGTCLVVDWGLDGATLVGQLPDMMAMELVG